MIRSVSCSGRSYRTDQIPWTTSADVLADPAADDQHGEGAIDDRRGPPATAARDQHRRGRGQRQHGQSGQMGGGELPHGSSASHARSARAGSYPGRAPRQSPSAGRRSQVRDQLRAFDHLRVRRRRPRPVVGARARASPRGSCRRGRRRAPAGAPRRPRSSARRVRATCSASDSPPGNANPSLAASNAANRSGSVRRSSATGRPSQSPRSDSARSSSTDTGAPVASDTIAAVAAARCIGEVHTAATADL